MLVSSTESQDPVYDIRLSSVVPAGVTENDKIHQLTYIDLAMKLHYIRALYFFHCDAVQGIDIYALKAPMFQWLDLYRPASGRIRRTEDRSCPFIKCNDGGVRVVEAKCSKTVDEWLAVKDSSSSSSVDEQLVYYQVLGPDLGFSPLVFLQFTWFKCGGLSVGLSWAHILGDVLSASTFINMWGQIMTHHVPPQPLNFPNTQFPNSFSGKPLSLKTIDSVGDYWLTPKNSCKMETYSFRVSEKLVYEAAKQKIFPFLTALLWKSIAKIREFQPKIVTICCKDSHYRGNEISSNSQVIGTVEVDFNIEKVGLLELGKWIEAKMLDERRAIEDYVEKEKSDFIVYGANLTFVDLEEADIYGLELRGKRPIFANVSVAGVGDEGVVLVLPAAKEGGGGGRTVTVTLPENQIVELKNELRKAWGIV